jgi:hypothetical protein
MAADCSSVNDNSTELAGRSNTLNPVSGGPGRVQPGNTAQEFISGVGNLKFPGGGFGDSLEAVQASQPLAEMPEWPD